jgi:hypothetical protein
MFSSTYKCANPHWQSLRKAILDLTKLNELGEDILENTILEKFQVFKQYLDYLLSKSVEINRTM